MNIKETALKVWYSKNEDMPADGMSKLAEFAEALVAELAKENKPVAWMYEYSYDLNGDKQGHWPVEMYTHVSFSRSKPSVESTPLYTLPPTAEQLVFRNERLVADYASLQEENNALRRIHAENLVIKDAEIARWKTVPMKYRRMEFNAQLQEENAALKERVVTLEKLQGVALIESLRAEVERLNAVIESNIDEGINKIMLMSDEQISALAGFEGRSTEDQETIARQCFEIAEQRADHMKLVEENHELRQQLAASQLEAKRLREALTVMVAYAREDGCGLKIADEAISSQTSAEALDAYVAEKVKEASATQKEYYESVFNDGGKQISKANRQRDLAVSAIENLVKQKGRHNTEIAYKKLVEALAAIKESEV